MQQDTKRIEKICQMLHPLVPFPFLNGGDLLRALATIESAFGHNSVPRYEPAYGANGRYFTTQQARYFQDYGVAAASSQGPWQVMFPTARELGFFVTPDELALPEVNGLVAVEYLKHRAARATSLEQIARAYNGGNIKAPVPKAYIDKLAAVYKRYNG